MARTSVLATLLFTDIVGSTNVAEEMGDLATKNALAGKSGVLDGRLANRGVGLAPFDVLADRVSKRLVDEIRTLTALAN